MPFVQAEVAPYLFAYVLKEDLRVSYSDENGSICTSRGQALSIGAERNRVNILFVSGEDERLGGGVGQIPQPHASIPASRGESLSIGAECNRANLPFVSCEDMTKIRGA